MAVDYSTGFEAGSIPTTKALMPTLLDKKQKIREQRAAEMRKFAEDRRRKNREMNYSKGNLDSDEGLLDSMSEEDDYMPVDYMQSQMNLDAFKRSITNVSPRRKLRRGLNQKPSDTFHFNYRTTLGSIGSFFSPTGAEAANRIDATFEGMEREEGGGGLYVGANELNAYLQGYGIPSMHAAGIVANVERESGGFLISRKQFEGGPGRGLFQFEGTRLTAMKKYMKDNYGNENEWETNWKAQVDFLMQETNKNNYERTMRNRFLMRNYSTPQEAAKGFMELVLRPKLSVREAAMKRMRTKMQQLPFFRNLGPLDNFSTDGVINSTTIIGPQQLEEYQTLNVIPVKRDEYKSFSEDSMRYWGPKIGWRKEKLIK
jgi:hypothetical protein